MDQKSGVTSLAFVLLAVEDKQDEAFTLCQRLYTDDPEMKAYWRIRLLMFVGLSSAGRGEHELTLSAFDQSYDLGHASGDYAGAVLAPSFSMLVTLRANKLQRIARYLRKAEQTEAILPDKQSFVTRVLVPGLLFVWRAEFDSIPRRFEVAVKNDAENNVMFHGLLLALQSLYWGYHGNREGAYRAREQINDEAVMGLMPDVLAWALWGLCLADGHASAWSEARENLRQMRDIERMLHSVVPEHRPLALLIYALEEAAADRPDSALEALSLAGAEPSNARKMYAAWPVLGPLRRDLDASSDRPKPPVPDVDRVLESYFRADSVSKEA